jgi:hypothetical protein
LAVIRYDIEMSPDGWRVSCNGVKGPPYAESSAAILDTLATARVLREKGEQTEVRLLELDGPRRVWRRLEEKDARLYR